MSKPTGTQPTPNIVLGLTDYEVLRAHGLSGFTAARIVMDAAKGIRTAQTWLAITRAVVERRCGRQVGMAQ